MDKAKEASENPTSKKRKRLDSLNLEKQKIRFIDEVKTFGTSILLCLKSPIYIGVLLGRLFDVFAFRGLSSFQAKFIENHYGMPQYQIAILTGIVGGLSYAGGIILGSLIMRKFKLDGRRAAAYCMFCSFLSIALTVSKVFLKCQSVNNSVGQLLSTPSGSNLTSSCNQNCYCDTSSLYPVCGRDGQPFFSPCHAGCTNFTINEDTTSIFSNCACTPDGDVSRDFCVSDCTVPLYLYFGLTILTGIIAGTSGIPNMLISLRCVPSEVRSVSMAFSGFLVSLLSSAPSPIVVGSVIDSACLLWNTACGREGACLLYDAGALRIRIHAMYGVLRATGLLFDIWVWYWAANLILMKSNKKDDKNKNKSVAVVETA